MADNYDDYSKDQLIRLLRERDRKPRFGLVWERDEIEHEEAVNEDFVALDFIPELSQEPIPPNPPFAKGGTKEAEGAKTPPLAKGGPGGIPAFHNLIIEGDNFDALRFLRMTHAGKVKCIYIDPPYNTGNRDFIYNDRFVDKEDVYKHSKWLEFMYRRLLLAKELLAEDGVIFVSIDDNEAFNLGLLMNRVFGEGNRVGVMVWSNVTDNNPTRIAVEHEYILCYALNINGCPTPWKSAEHDIKDQMLEVEAAILSKFGRVEELQNAYTAWFKAHKTELPPLDNYKYFDNGGIYAGSRSIHNPGKEGYNLWC